jgi:Flp pilus assembly protein TadD
MGRTDRARDEGVEGPARPARVPAWLGRAWWRALPLGLALVVAVAFRPVLDNGFLYFDDDENFFENLDFRGLGWPEVRWAWTTFLLGVYQPLAWMLLEAQYVAFGLDPRGYHGVSLALQAACAVVLYGLIVALLARCPGVPAREDRRALHAGSILAAALFAVHPLRVEVVAWASCQPYLPCVGLAMLAVVAYLRASDPGRPHQLAWLTVAWALFVGALLSKAVAVTLPFVLLILDVYPLRRLGPGHWTGPSARRVWWEKVPFAAVGLVFMAVAVLAKRSNESLAAVENYGVVPRVAQSCYATWFYLVKTVLPLDLSAYYALPTRRADFLRGPFVLAALATVVMSAVAIGLRRRWPGLLAAWAAYLVILGPNIGIARIGNQIAADRYSYVASIPWAVLAGYGVFRGTKNRPRLVAAGAAVGLGMVLGLAAMTWRQCRTWRTTETLWTQVLEHGGREVAAAHFHLGAELARQGKIDSAMAEQAEALRLDPRSPDAHNLMGDVLDRQGRSDEAFAQFAEAVRLDPGSPEAQNNLGAALARRGALNEAMPHLAEAVRLKPHFALARRNLGLVLARRGKLRQAIAQLTEAARLDPAHAETHGHLGFVLAQVGRLDEAVAELAEAVRLQPGSAAIRTNLGLALEERGRLGEAVTQYAEAARLEPGRADTHFLLGSALARQGRRDAAAAQFTEALRLDPNHPEARQALAEIRAGPGH